VAALSEYDLDELRERFASWGFSAAHAARVLRAFYSGDGKARGRWPLPHDLAERLFASHASLTSLAARQVADDGTVKLLLRLGDGRAIESVLMPAFRGDRAAGCISSQVGCAMGCDFCATAKMGYERNLTAGEIVEQFVALRSEALSQDRRLQTVVFMGMGEPMLNLDNVIAAVKRIAGNELGGLGWRQVTVSTVGIVPGIEALAAARLGVNLAVSLHAPDDETRERLLPSGKRFKVVDILEAAQDYQSAFGRPVSIQYCLLKDVNDSLPQARLLAELLSGRKMHVNLLRYNPTGPGLRGREYAPVSDEDAEGFIAELRARGVVAHFRRPRGPDIDAACGQLRRKVSGLQN
jgi:23S rRNA (adenine2503-C2)-methyltransferase